MPSSTQLTSRKCYVWQLGRKHCGWTVGNMESVLCCHDRKADCLQWPGLSANKRPAVDPARACTASTAEGLGDQRLPRHLGWPSITHRRTPSPPHVSACISIRISTSTRCSKVACQMLPRRSLQSSRADRHCSHTLTYIHTHTHTHRE